MLRIHQGCVRCVVDNVLPWARLNPNEILPQSTFCILQCNAEFLKILQVEAHFSLFKLSEDHLSSSPGNKVPLTYITLPYETCVWLHVKNNKKK